MQSNRYNERTIMRHILKWFLLCGVILLPVTSQGQNPRLTDSVIQRIDAILSQWDNPTSPGCALGIIHESDLIYKRGYGLANLDHTLPIDSKSVFRIGSTSKQFTAMAILLLEEQGKLSLDDDIRRFLPEMPQYDRPVTIRHLIHHTSGIRDYLTLMTLAGMRDDDFVTDGEVLDLIASQKALNFLPGEEYLYSNSGYLLLSIIVQRASGKTLRQFAKDNIFDPLGMTHTHFHDDHTMIVPNRASGYAPRDTSGFQISMTTLDMVGDGGVFTTVDDLLLWDDNFYRNRLGKSDPQLINKMITPGILNNGTSLTYAFGLSIGQHQGHKMISHGGAFVGYRAEMIRLPELRFSVICLANLGTMNPSRLSRQVADLFLVDYFDLELPDAANSDRVASHGEKIILEVPHQTLKQWTGIFRDEKSGDVIKITLEDNQLLFTPQGGRPYPIAAISESTFVLKDYPDEIEIQFKLKKSNWSVRISNQDDPDEVYNAISVFVPSEKQLSGYTGRYHSSELSVTYIVRQDEKKLFLFHENPHKGFPKEPMETIIKDEFIHFGLNLNFSRNGQGDVSGFSMKAGRVKDIHFDRVDTNNHPPEAKKSRE